MLDQDGEACLTSASAGIIGADRAPVRRGADHAPMRRGAYHAQCRRWSVQKQVDDGGVNGGVQKQC